MREGRALEWNLGHSLRPTDQARDQQAPHAKAKMMHYFMNIIHPTFF